MTEVILQDYSSLNMFADDMTLYRVIKSNNDYIQLQNDVNAVSTLMNARLLQFNATKCKFMFVSKKISLSFLPPALHLKWHLFGTGSKLQVSGTHLIF